MLSDRVPDSKIACDRRFRDRLCHLHVQRTPPGGVLLLMTRLAALRADILMIGGIRSGRVRRTNGRRRVPACGNHRRHASHDERGRRTPHPVHDRPLVMLMSPLTTSIETTGEPRPIVASPKRGPNCFFTLSGMSD